MSTKISEATLVSTVNDNLKLPVGGYGDDDPYAVSVGQLKEHIDNDLADVAKSGSYLDLSDTPDLSGYATLNTLNTSYYNKTAVDNLIPTVNNPTVTFKQGGVTKGSITLNQSSGATINFDEGGGGGVQSDWTETNTDSPAYIKNKPTLSTVATSGSYNDLTNTPTIPAAQVNSDWSASSGVEQILNKPSLATVATSGSYNDLTNKPTIPEAQVNSDWNASSGISQILNKPSLATVATTGSYSDLTNKPTIPSNTRSLLITYDDESQETITVYTT